MIYRTFQEATDSFKKLLINAGLDEAEAIQLHLRLEEQDRLNTLRLQVRHAPMGASLSEDTLQEIVYTQRCQQLVCLFDLYDQEIETSVPNSFFEVGFRFVHGGQIFAEMTRFSRKSEVPHFRHLIAMQAHQTIMKLLGYEK